MTCCVMLCHATLCCTVPCRAASTVSTAVHWWVTVHTHCTLCTYTVHYVHTHCTYTVHCTLCTTVHCTCIVHCTLCTTVHIVHSVYIADTVATRWPHTVHEGAKWCHSGTISGSDSGHLLEGFTPDWAWVASQKGFSF